MRILGESGQRVGAESSKAAGSPRVILISGHTQQRQRALGACGHLEPISSRDSANPVPALVRGARLAREKRRRNVCKMRPLFPIPGAT